MLLEARIIRHCKPTIMNTGLRFFMLQKWTSFFRDGVYYLMFCVVFAKYVYTVYSAEFSNNSLVTNYMFSITRFSHVNCTLQCCTSLCCTSQHCTSQRCTSLCCTLQCKCKWKQWHYNLVGQGITHNNSIQCTMCLENMPLVIFE